MSSAVPAPVPSSCETVRLHCTFQAPSLRHATALAETIRTTKAEVTAIRPARRHASAGREWAVTLNAPPLPLKLDALRAWEREMLAVEHARPGCRFLGWSVQAAPASDSGPVGRSRPEDRCARERHTQRELVTASLLRCPPGERRGVVHGRAA